MRWRYARSGLNVVLLLSALVCTPLLLLSHFHAGLAGMMAELADGYLPNSTLLSREKRANRQLAERARSARVERARQQGVNARRVRAGSEVVKGSGRRILLRGAGAMAVGWIPVVGVAADVYSLSEDYVDVCTLLGTIDEYAAMLAPPSPDLYRESYCHKPEEGIEIIKREAQGIRWQWQPGPPDSPAPVPDTPGGDAP